MVVLSISEYRGPSILYTSTHLDEANAIVSDDTDMSSDGHGLVKHEGLRDTVVVNGGSE